VFLLNINALGFGATAIPGIAIISTQGGGHLHFVIANVITIVIGMILTIVYAKIKNPSYDA